MEFLYKLYSNDYFGIGLFIVITILAFSFLVILFFGKKDEKERNKEIEDNIANKENTIEETEKEEELKTESLESVNLPVENVPVLEPVQETIPEELPIETDPFVSSNMVLNTDLINEEKTVDTPVEMEMPETNEEETISTEPSIDDSFAINLDLPETPVMDKPNEEVTIDPFDIENPVITNLETPVIEEPVQNNIFAEPVEIKEEVPKKVTMPTQFSSVYLTKEKEVAKPEVEEKEEELAPIPLKPTFELPKTLDLPKLNKDSGVSEASNDNIIKPLNSTEGNLNSIFENIEEDSYTINK